MCGFFVSVLLCGARVLDDVGREAQAGQLTRKARSQVLPCLALPLRFFLQINIEFGVVLLILPENMNFPSILRDK